jgi:hypothetical protein
MTEITAERLRELLDYDAATGWFRWRVQVSSNVRVGGIAGNYAAGYWQIKIDRRNYRAHRLAWLFMTGKFPDHEIDHIDGDGTHNAWPNLREATHAQNMANYRRRKKNASGFKGVYQQGSSSSWFAHIWDGERLVHLGSFPTREEAHAAYLAAARSYHGEFANGG